MTAIVWLRRTLREYDNTALVEAAQEHEEVVPFYVVDQHYFQNADLGYPRVRFWHESLNKLSEELDQDGKDLILRHGKPVEELRKVIEEVSADKIYYNRDYTPYSRQRDQKVRELDIEVESFKDIVMFEKEEILTNGGDPYQTYTYFAKKWFDRDKRRPREPDNYIVPELKSDEMPSLEKLGFEKPEEMEWIWKPGRAGAKERMEDFKDEILDYDDNRDYAWKDKTSKLSPHLKFGTISVRELFWEAERLKARNPDTDTSGIKTWQEELAWRDFYFQMLWNYPESAEKALQDQFRTIEWRSKEENQDDWERFIEGRTGYPFVDAGMRQLKKTGWMHNRLRMVVTSFACKDLWLDWQDLHEYFSEMFVDAEISAMIGGIQWAYSIGTDAQPYFRVFNPTSQGEKYDPEGEYIRKWVPELEQVPDEHIQEPWKMNRLEQQNCGVEIGKDYPEPIVDHDIQRKEAVEKFEEARE